MSEEVKIDLRGFALDKPTVDARTAAYPDDVRDGARWMAGFINRRCNGELQGLAGLVTKLGFETSDGTLSKIVRGQWNRDASGNPSVPCMRQAAFLELIFALQRHDRLLDMSDGIPFVETRTFKSIRNYVEARSRPGRICKMGFIAGPTGAQKSKSFAELARRSNHLTVFHYECPEKANMGETVIQLCKLFGKPPQGNSTRKKLELAECVKADTTLIIDNIQKLYKPKDGNDQRAFNYFQKLQDDTKCTLILSATYEFMHQFQGGIHRGYFEQFIGRCGGAGKVHILPKFAYPDDVLAFAQAFQLKDAEKHRDYLVAISRLGGRIRTLLQNLQDAKGAADDEGAPFTVEHLREQLINPENKKPYTTAELKALCVEPDDEKKKEEA
jgi:DNA transposition AAA+ family ATPase